MMRSAIVAFVVACSSSTPAPPPSQPSPTPQPVVETDAAPTVPEPVDAAPPPPEVDAGEAPIACKTDDDCWIGDDGKLVVRPKAKRGKKLKACKDSERLPACKQNVCVINAYKC